MKKARKKRDDILNNLPTGGGFSKEESEVMDKIIEAHNLYMKLKVTHPSDHNEWITAIHTLQYLLSMRILQREHSEIFEAALR